MFTFHVEPAARAHGRVMPECRNSTAVSPAEAAALSAIERVLKFPHGAAMRCRDLAPVGTSGNRKLPQSSRVAARGRLPPSNPQLATQECRSVLPLLIRSTSRPADVHDYRAIPVERKSAQNVRGWRLSATGPNLHRVYLFSGGAYGG